MTVEEVRTFCDNYDGSVEGFQKIISEFVSLDEHHAVALASSYQIAISTIRRWIKGSSRPHPGIRRHIAKHIKIYLKAWT